MQGDGRVEDAGVSDLVPVRLEICGPEYWAAKFVDARTGEILPIYRGFTVNFPDEGPITANCTIEISEIVGEEYIKND